jgi:hypothetical protein
MSTTHTTIVRRARRYGGEESARATESIRLITMAIAACGTGSRFGEGENMNETGVEEIPLQ